MKRLFGTALLGVIALAGGLSCGGDATASGPGVLQVRLTTPPGTTGVDSAIVFTIVSPTPLTSATAAAGLRLFEQPLGTTTRFALIGQLTNGATILTIGVQDVSQLSQYAGSVDGVAQANYQLRASGGYALAVTR